mgnify:CR=1 FL=1
MEDTWTRVSMLTGLALFCLVVVAGLPHGAAPVPLLGRAGGTGLFAGLLVRVSISIARSVLQECLGEEPQKSENTVEEETQP